MLELINIRKTYQTGDEVAVALNDVNLSFGDNGFVSILGTSGSGKTTLLNIIGGLDKYTTGDLIVDGTSTKKFKDRNWDSYRNSTVGFVFQSYNLISHLSILENVKMALSLTGVSSKTAEKKAKKALKEVGLEKHIKKRPNQLSGGQMQRVAIARSLVNDPQILLADEPTGALDSHTSVQIMEIIKKISKNRLVIMVTHNPDLADQYSDRIIRVSDGEVIEDTAPHTPHRNDKQDGYKIVKTSMSFWAAIKSSLQNLLTKKARTIMVTFAGSIGIISIGLVLALSNGMKDYIDSLQRDTLSGIPITISASDPFASMMSGPPASVDTAEKADEKSTTIKARQVSEAHQNNYSEDLLGNGQTFINYFEKNAKDYYSTISYTSGYQLKPLTKDLEGNVIEAQLNKNAVMMGQMTGVTSVFSELPGSQESILNQYKVIASIDKEFKFPTKKEEMVLVLGKSKTLSEDTLKALGYNPDKPLDFKDILGKEFSMIDNDNYFQAMPDTSFFQTKTINQDMFDSGIKTKIVGILQAKDDNSSLLTTDIVYTTDLTKALLAKEETSTIVATQKSEKNKNVLSPSNEKIDEQTRTTVLQQLGGDLTPTQISIYPTTFEERNKVIDVIGAYNKLITKKYGAESEEETKNSIQYSDMAEIMTSMMTMMIDTVTAILTAFAGISLVVSSVMIGILTYVSVVERTKEIGIMRALGARKKDITRIFNAEAGIIGFISGVLGVGIASLLTLPINAIIQKVLDIEHFNSALTPVSATLLVILSLVLTLIAGFLPSKSAAKKDPVEALRTE